jgi:hypothetical protein
MLASLFIAFGDKGKNWKDKGFLKAVKPSAYFTK